MANPNNRINCYKCKYFYITWDKHFPNGCKGLDFKSQQLPSVVVFNCSGMQCLKLEEKEKLK